MAAGTEAGGYDDFAAAQRAMTEVATEQCDPDPAARTAYDRLYALYRILEKEKLVPFRITR